MAIIRRVFCCVVLLGAAAALPAQAGVFTNIVRGLEYSGFQFAGQSNPLSGGSEFYLGRTFTGETLDFGATDLTLSGPINFTFSTGGRTLPVLDFSLSTNDQPFEYVYQTSTGSEDYLVEGSFLLDATGSINTFGFYDLRLQLSSRQDVFLDGRYQDGTEEQLDFDIGPIDVSGNIFADLLAQLFDPFFTVLGIENPFDSFSGRTQRENMLQAMVADAQTKLDTGAKLSAEEIGKIMGLSDAFSRMGDDVPDLSFIDNTLANEQALFQPIPEPGALMFLLGPVAYLIARRRHR